MRYPGLQGEVGEGVPGLLPTGPQRAMEGVRSGAGPPTGSPKQPSRLGAALWHRIQGLQGLVWMGEEWPAGPITPSPDPVPAGVLTQERAELWNRPRGIVGRELGSEIRLLQKMEPVEWPAHVCGWTVMPVTSMAVHHHELA